jgi:hypothetical protein
MSDLWIAVQIALFGFIAFSLEEKVPSPRPTASRPVPPESSTTNLELEENDPAELDRFELIFPKTSLKTPVFQIQKS